MKRFMRLFQPALLKFVERDSKLEAATKMEEAAAEEKILNEKEAAIKTAASRIIFNWN